MDIFCLPFTTALSYVLHYMVVSLFSASLLLMDIGFVSSFLLLANSGVRNSLMCFSFELGIFEMDS